MVNKGTFLQRLRERWGSGSGVRIEKTGASGRDPAAAAATRAAPGRLAPNGRDPAANAPAELRSSRKLSEREEALLALSGHFQELTALLRGGQARTEDKLQQLVDATSSLGALPALSQQQLEALRSLSAQMDRQNQLGEQLATTMQRLPSLLENVETALQRAAATDQRTAATVREFQTTMDRIHGAMAQMVQNSDTQARSVRELADQRSTELRDLATGITRTQQEAVAELQRTTADGLQSLRRTHEDQSNRLQRVVQEHAGWNRAVLVGIGLCVIGLGIVIVLQLVR